MKYCTTLKPRIALVRVITQQIVVSAAMKSSSHIGK